MWPIGARVRNLVRNRHATTLMALQTYAPCYQAPPPNAAGEVLVLVCSYPIGFIHTKTTIYSRLELPMRFSRKPAVQGLCPPVWGHTRRSLARYSVQNDERPGRGDSEWAQLHARVDGEYGTARSESLLPWLFILTSIRTNTFFLMPHHNTLAFSPGYCWSQLRPASESLLSRELFRLAEHVRGKRGAYALSILLPDGFRNLSLALVRYFALPDNPWGERGPPVVTHPTYKTDWTEPRETYPVLISPLLYSIQYIHTQFHSLHVGDCVQRRGQPGCALLQLPVPDVPCRCVHSLLDSGHHGPNSGGQNQGNTVVRRAVALHRRATAKVAT
jgi:hypothetical protein